MIKYYSFSTERESKQTKQSIHTSHIQTAPHQLLCQKQSYRSRAGLRQWSTESIPLSGFIWYYFR